MDIQVVNTGPEHFEALAVLQQAVFQNIPAEELFTVEMYRQHVKHFPEGQFVAIGQTLSGAVIVGATTTMRTNEMFDGDDHPYYFDFIGRGTISTSDPNGAWLYGIDVGVHPGYRRMGIASRLYEARADLVRRLNLRGEIVAGLLPGYPRYREQMSVAAYVERVVAREINDPTLSMQLGVGFHFRKLLRNYVTDVRSDNLVTLIVRENPDYKEALA